jgi:hypothetical protein
VDAETSNLSIEQHDEPQVGFPSVVPIISSARVFVLLKEGSTLRSFLKQIYRDATLALQLRCHNLAPNLALSTMDDLQGQSSEWSRISPHRRTEEQRIDEQEFRQRREAIWA